MSKERERLEELGKKMKRESDVFSSQMGRGHMFGGRGPGPGPGPGPGHPAGGGSSGTLNTITPCAACKLLRRRCAQECPFSPYFSPHEPQKFASVHKVFGASNVSKMLMEVPESRRADAANSLVYEANARQRDPVFGCMGAISALQQQVESLQAELNAVRAEILHHKYKETSNTSTNIVPSNSNLALLSSGAVFVAAMPPTPSPPQPPPLPPPPSVLPRTFSSSSMYSLPSTATDFSTISNENISYFG